MAKSCFLFPKIRYNMEYYAERGKGMDILDMSLRELSTFAEFLYAEGQSEATVRKYSQDIAALLKWLNGAPFSAEKAAQWKALLLENHSPTTVNAKLASLNAYCRSVGVDIRMSFVRVQRRLFREKSRELTQKDFRRLMETAEAEGKERLALLMETICACGTRVSETKFFTVESVKKGVIDVCLKSKVRTILLPQKLQKKLLEYAAAREITKGQIFITRTGRGLTRGQIWAEMKALCEKAGVERTKVYPHNLRHLFARTFYNYSHDIAKLADLLGHSSINTTRLYLISTGEEHQKLLDEIYQLT